MFEAPTGPATRRSLLDAGYMVGLLAGAIFCGYGLLAPERLGLVSAAEPPTRIVGAITPPVSDSPSVPQVGTLTPSVDAARREALAPRPAGPARPVEMARLAPDTRPPVARPMRFQMRNVPAVKGWPSRISETRQPPSRVIAMGLVYIEFARGSLAD